MQRVSDQLGAPRVTPAMWEQRRYEIARDFFAINSTSSIYRGTKPKDVAAEAVAAADSLIEQLKKPKQ